MFCPLHLINISYLRYLHFSSYIRIGFFAHCCFYGVFGYGLLVVFAGGFWSMIVAFLSGFCFGHCLFHKLEVVFLFIVVSIESVDCTGPFLNLGWLGFD